MAQEEGINREIGMVFGSNTVEVQEENGACPKRAKAGQVETFW